jgi:FkbM family methyltransferase
MACVRAVVAVTLSALLAFGSGLLLGDRYGGAFRTVLDRSSRCFLLDLPATYRSRAQRRQAAREVEAGSRLEKQDSPGFEFWSTPDGNWWIPRADRETLFLVLAEQKCDIYTSSSSGVRAGDVVLDCGAHIGSFTRNALLKGAKRVVAIEPASENLECLRRNFASEIAAGRVILYPKGVWDREDTLLLSAAGSAVHEVIGSDDANNRCSTRVPLTTIDALVRELQLERVDFVKMDIEGAEERALLGAQSTLAAYRPRLAIAGYHSREGFRAIEHVVLKSSATYRMQCGPCYSARGMRPETLFFH